MTPANPLPSSPPPAPGPRSLCAKVKPHHLDRRAVVALARRRRARAYHTHRQHSSPFFFPLAPDSINPILQCTDGNLPLLRKLLELLSTAFKLTDQVQPDFSRFVSPSVQVHSLRSKHARRPIPDG